MNTSLNIGDRLELHDADEIWLCVVVKVEGELLHVRTYDGRDVCLHYSWFRKIHNRKEVSHETIDGGGSGGEN